MAGSPCAVSSWHAFPPTHPVPRTPQVVEKEGWVYIRVPLDEKFMELVESCLGFQQWRGLQDVYVDGVVSGRVGR